MEGAEWRMQNAGWRMGNGEWGMENGEWRMENVGILAAKAMILTSSTQIVSFEFEVNPKEIFLTSSGTSKVTPLNTHSLDDEPRSTAAV